MFSELLKKLKCHNYLLKFMRILICLKLYWFTLFQVKTMAIFNLSSNWFWQNQKNFNVFLKKPLVKSYKFIDLCDSFWSLPFEKRVSTQIKFFKAFGHSFALLKPKLAFFADRFLPIVSKSLTTMLNNTAKVLTLKRT